MNKKFFFAAFPIGLAMFSMFFGAGNIVFPLAVGQYAADKNIFAILGLILTAAVVPVLGVIAMILFDGDYRRFFGKLGKWPGFLLAFTIISLLGPFGSTPRCIALSYTTMKNFFPDASSFVFSAFACIIIFLFSRKQTQILRLLGYWLTPLLLASLAAILGIGFFSLPQMRLSGQSELHVFFHGLQEGYNTMDLLAAFFFSSQIVMILKKEARFSRGKYLTTALVASVIGAFFLAVVYIGFSYLAAYHGQDISNSRMDELLAMIIVKIAGEYGGFLVAVAIALACLTTAIALISAFADFVEREVFLHKIRYEWILAGSLVLTFCVSIFEFGAISAFLGPVLQVCYPGLIALTFWNIFSQMRTLQERAP
jgi:LIVCS family branched-chain amino acid:cation transporter